MDELKILLNDLWEALTEIARFFTVKLFSIGNSEITLITIVYLFISVILLNFFSNKLSKFIGNTVLKKYTTIPSTAQSVSTIIRYIFLVVGLMVIVQTAGIDLSALSILAGALGVGIGFGLQNITNNFISGIIILFEQPIKLGDRIEVGDIKGDVLKISARATTVVTNDNISVIVPNSEFISSTFINWSHNY